jgi:hypothetical protein
LHEPNSTALEGILGIRNHGLVVTGLYEIHQPAFNVPKLKFYYGFGAHVGAVGSGVYKRFNGSDDTIIMIAAYYWVPMVF